MRAITKAAGRTVNIVRGSNASIRPAVSGSNTVGNNTSPAVDRSRNIILTGVSESRDSDTWNDTIMRAITKAAGRTVNIDDAFRLGRFHQQKIRPILVKLTSVWDRRLILGGAHKLKDDDELGRVYINPDEPLEVRRQHMLDRLRKRAHDNGQEVSVSSDGVLSVDGSIVFSLQSGFVNRLSTTTTSNG